MICGGVLTPLMLVMLCLMMCVNIRRDRNREASVEPLLTQVLPRLSRIDGVQIVGRQTTIGNVLGQLYERRASLNGFFASKQANKLEEDCTC